MFGESGGLRRNDEGLVVILGEGFDVVGFAESTDESGVEVGAVLIWRIRMTSEEEELEFLLRELTDSTSPVLVLAVRVVLEGGLEGLVESDGFLAEVGLDDGLVEIEDATVRSGDAAGETVCPENGAGDGRDVGEGRRIVLFSVEDFLDVEELTMPEAENGRLTISPLLMKERAFGESFEGVDNLEDVGKPVGSIFDGEIHDVAELLLELADIEAELFVVLVEGIVIDIEEIVGDLLEFGVLLGEGGLDFFDFVGASDTSIGTDLEVGEAEEETRDIDEVEQIVAAFEEGVHAAEQGGVLEAPGALEFLDGASLVQEEGGLELTAEGEDGSELLLDFFRVLVEDIHDVQVLLGVENDVVGDLVDEVGHLGDGGETRAVGPDQEEEVEQLTEDLLLGDLIGLEVTTGVDVDELESFGERLEVAVNLGGFFQGVVKFVDEGSEGGVEVRISELEDDDGLDDEGLAELFFQLHQVLSLALPEADFVEGTNRTAEKRRERLLGNGVDGLANQVGPLGDGGFQGEDEGLVGVGSRWVDVDGKLQVGDGKKSEVVSATHCDQSGSGELLSDLHHLRDANGGDGSLFDSLLVAHEGNGDFRVDIVQGLENIDGEIAEHDSHAHGLVVTKTVLWLVLDEVKDFAAEVELMAKGGIVDVLCVEDTVSTSRELRDEDRFAVFVAEIEKKRTIIFIFEKFLDFKRFELPRSHETSLEPRETFVKSFFLCRGHIFVFLFLKRGSKKR